MRPSIARPDPGRTGAAPPAAVEIPPPVRERRAQLTARWPSTVGGGVACSRLAGRSPCADRVARTHTGGFHDCSGSAARRTLSAVGRRRPGPGRRLRQEVHDGGRPAHRHGRHGRGVAQPDGRRLAVRIGLRVRVRRAVGLRLAQRLDRLEALAQRHPHPHREPPAVRGPAPVAKAGPVAPPPPAVPPHTPPLQSSCKPSYTGTNEPKSAVGDALTAAAAKSRTFTLSSPSGGRTTDTLPPLPAALVKAIAWQESGWQSAILACDGGIGTMQVMPGTVSTMNAKYSNTSDPHTLAGNVQLGTEYLDWLVAYYGDSCFGGDYDLSPDPVSGKTPLLDLVIAAYNAGAGNVHYNLTTDPATGAQIGESVIPNPSYVANVKALMNKAPWTNAS
ncbi:lytic transglycosylase domain-containing protein [Kitasatospora cheerisanensis]|nr:lytic transglycosylase domain-containing protein [Kitasatospora cheerisanensis]